MCGAWRARISCACTVQGIPSYVSSPCALAALSPRPPTAHRNTSCPTYTTRQVPAGCRGRCAHLVRSFARSAVAVRSAPPLTSAPTVACLPAHYRMPVAASSSAAADASAIPLAIQQLFDQLSRLPSAVRNKLVLPSTLPVIVLTEAERVAGYGIPLKALPAIIKRELKGFEAWCTQVFNVLRSAEYARPVQSTSIMKTLEVIRAYLGFVAKHFSITPNRLGLHHYADAIKLVRFFAFLMVSLLRRRCWGCVASTQSCYMSCFGCRPLMPLLLSPCCAACAGSWRDERPHAEAGQCRQEGQRLPWLPPCCGVRGAHPPPGDQGLAVQAGNPDVSLHAHPPTPSRAAEVRFGRVACGAVDVRSTQACSPSCYASVFDCISALPTESAPLLLSLCRFKIIKQWSDGLANDALHCVDMDMTSYSHITANTARKASVQSIGEGGEGTLAACAASACPPAFDVGCRLACAPHSAQRPSLSTPSSSCHAGPLPMRAEPAHGC